MVKSFQGVRVIEPKQNVQSLKVEDFMSRHLITFHPEQPMEQVIDTLIAKKISGGPVVNDLHQLVGVISEGDCLKEVVRGKYNNTPSPSGKVKDRMAREVKTVSPDMNILDVAQLFLNLRLRRFPVLHEGKLVGQISQRDVMRAVQNMKRTTW